MTENQDPQALDNPEASDELVAGYSLGPDESLLGKTTLDLLDNCKPEKTVSMPHLPVTDHPDTGLQGTMSSSALNVVWSYGVNPTIGVHNLTDTRRSAVVYACSHVAVMYDYDHNKQYILQGHLNCITCICVSDNKRWLITGDKGPDATVIAWDTYTGVPIQTIYDPNPDGGFVAVALTPKGSYLATVSAAGPEQVLAVWEWTVNGERPLCSVDLTSECGIHHHLKFSSQDYHFLVSTGEKRVIFVHWDEDSIQYFAPALADSGFRRPVGNFTQSLYQNNTTKVLTTTTGGYIVIWDNNTTFPNADVPQEQTADKKATKTVHVSHMGIDAITQWDQFVVVGDQGGQVLFLFGDLTMAHWYKLGLSSINAVSFKLNPTPSVQLNEDLMKKRRNLRRSIIKPDVKFVALDFVVGTSESLIATVTHNGECVKIIQREHESAVHAMTVHPSQPYIAMSSYSNMIKVWNYETKEVMVSRTFERNGGFHTLAYDPKGFYIVVGQTNGAVRILDALTLYDETAQLLRIARFPITHIVFSPDSAFMATADAGYATSLFCAQKPDQGSPYYMLARYRAHTKPICDLAFFSLVFDKTRLFSLGADRLLVEYDLEKSTKGDLIILNWDRVEQSAVPCCMSWYPPFNQEPFLIMANDQFKLKLYNFATKMCRKTLRGPTYGSPVKRLLVVPDQGSDTRRYAAYATEDKVGLMILPVDGNPHKAMALMAHPFGVSRLAVSHDGRYLFTAGGSDRTVHMWEINIAALEAQAKVGGDGLIPFYGLMEGGREGPLFAELENYFYYSLLRSQGLDCMEMHQLSTSVPASELPFLMRSLNYYPTEQEIEDMQNEVKFSRYAETGQYVQEVDLGVVVQLYVNHRPVFGYTFDHVKWAFDTLTATQPTSSALPRGEMLDLLQSRGEHMTEYELAECLATLLGLRPEGGTSEGHKFDPAEAASVFEHAVPRQISAPVFMQDIMGLDMNEQLSLPPPLPSPPPSSSPSAPAPAAIKPPPL